MSDHKLKLIQVDPWLEPSAQDIEDRYQRYLNRLDSITGDFGGLENFARGHTYFGINYDPLRKGWTYREWAPQANGLYLTGDFNNWEKFSHPLEMN